MALSSNIDAAFSNSLKRKQALPHLKRLSKINKKQLNTPEKKTAYARAIIFLCIYSQWKNKYIKD